MNVFKKASRDGKRRRKGGVTLFSVTPWLLLLLLFSKAMGEPAELEPTELEATLPPAAVEAAVDEPKESPAPTAAPRRSDEEKNAAQDILDWIPEGVEYTLGGISGWSLPLPEGYAGEEVFLGFSGSVAEGEAFYEEVLTTFVEKLDAVGFVPTEDWYAHYEPALDWQPYNLQIAKDGAWAYGMEGYFGDSYVAFSMVMSATLDDVDSLFGDEAPEPGGLEIEVIFVLAEKMS